MSLHSYQLLHEAELAVGVGAADAASQPTVRHVDPLAVERALRQHYPGLVELLARRVGDRQLARDVLHDAIVTALSKLEAGAQLPAEVLAGYVFRTAMNHLRNQRRHERLQRGDSDAIDALAADSGMGPAEQSRQAGLRDLVRRVLRDLASNRDRELLVRFYLDDEDKVQLCEAHGLTGPQFDRVICRARDRLRALVERAGCSRWDLLSIAMLIIAMGWGG